MAVRVVKKIGVPDGEEGLATTTTAKPRWSRSLFFVALACCALFFLQVASVAEEKGEYVEDVEVRTKGIKGNKRENDEACRGICTNITKARTEKFGGNLLDRADLLRVAKQAKEKLIKNLKKDYGDYFEPIFVTSGKAFSPASEGGPSMERLKRKLMIKGLEVQTNILKQDKNVANSCDCTVGGGKALVSNVESVGNETFPIDDTYSRYVWATGGHSAAAGHGNLFNETYTAYMGRDARTVFGAIGIEFEDRNYAMGGTSSGLEVSMCWQQIFGDDVDAFSWDYGMTDGNTAQIMMHYGYRGGLSADTPAFFAIHAGGSYLNAREALLLSLEEHGMATFKASNTDESFTTRHAGVPDSAGISQEEIDALPEYVRNLKCGDQLENGDPYCNAEKYSTGLCSPRSKQASWHPGFKVLAMDGHAIGLFMVDTLIDALIDLANFNMTDASASELLKHELQTQEHEIQQKLRNASLSAEMVDSLYVPNDKAPKDPTLDVNLLWQGSSICRTARLPAQSRYLGYTTNTEKVGGISVLGSEMYDVGTPIDDAREARTSNGSMPLVYEMGDGERQKCEVILKPDYKDFFYTNKAYGLSKLSFPNEKERKAYGYDPSHYKGLLLIVFTACDWGRCDEGELRAEDHPSGKYEVSVNGKPVTEMLSAGFEAWILKGDEGLYWQPNPSGVFDVGFLVKEDTGFLKISAIILY